MPYITEKEKRSLAFKKSVPTTPGELNYKFTKLLDEYVNKMGLCYTVLNDCLGALEGAKLEFYRRVVVPYEERKLDENGDVYTCETDS